MIISTTLNKNKDKNVGQGLVLNILTLQNIWHIVYLSQQFRELLIKKYCTSLTDNSNRRAERSGGKFWRGKLER